MNLPFEPLDKACLAASRAPWATFAPTWRLEYRGTVSEAELTTALERILIRYPWCAARAVNLSWVVPEKPEAKVATLDLRSGADPAKELALSQRHLDLEKEAPLVLTWVRRTDDSGVLVFQQHHALADGRAFFAMLADFVAALDGPISTAVIPRRKERDALAASLDSARDERRGAFSSHFPFLRGMLAALKDLFLAMSRPLAPLSSNTGTDYTGADLTRHLFLPLARVEAWREARKKLGLSANDLLAGALCAALTRWSHSHGAHNLLMPIDVRPREGFESFANHLGALQLRWPGGTQTPLQLAHHFQRTGAPIVAARLPWLRTLFDGFILRITPLSALRAALLDRRRLLTNYSFSNLIPLGPATPWKTPTMQVERILITTPCTPPQAANTTVVRYVDELCFNFNFKASALTPAQVEALITGFEHALAELDTVLLAP